MFQHDIEHINQLGKSGNPFLFVINYKQNKVLTFLQKELEKEEILFLFNKAGNVEQSHSTIPQNLEKYPISLQQYTYKFDRVQEALNYGYSYLVNLTQPTNIESNLTLYEIFHQSSAKYQLLIPGKFVVFSPETFVKIENNTISTHPMKGTIDANTPNARTQILNSKKEMAEHATIVDLLRNDLSRVASNVKVERYRYIEEIKTPQHHLLQVSSEIKGILTHDWPSRLGDLLNELLPAGSITGAPKPQTLKIIDEIEGYDRGFYTGIAGYFDGRTLDSCVLIRYIEKNGSQLIYKSGGGITTQSIAEDEYQELIQKVYVPIN